MVSKVKVDMMLCSHETTIEAKDSGHGTVEVRFESSCKDVSHFARLLTSVSPDDYSKIIGSRILELAEKAGMTPTCLVPAAVFNVCWLETGMISKNLVKQKKSISIHFVD
ncbi:MAG: hypothetical protein ABSB83_04725 [Methanomassiliicoccales archaeon]|jgi:hypothetical protein